MLCNAYWLFCPHSLVVPPKSGWYTTHSRLYWHWCYQCLAGVDDKCSKIGTSANVRLRQLHHETHVLHTPSLRLPWLPLPFRMRAILTEPPIPWKASIIIYISNNDFWSTRLPLSTLDRLGRSVAPDLDAKVAEDWFATFPAAAFASSARASHCPVSSSRRATGAIC